MDMFLKRGFAVFIYDHRNHGLSGGSDTSYGYYEKFDLKKCTDWVFDKLGKDIMEGLHGEEDDYVPVIMCNQMYSVKNGYKDIYIAPGAGHAEAYWKNRDEYEEKVDRFLKAINMC